MQNLTLETIEALRATAHAAFPETLPAAGRFKGISDLEAARVLRALENGTEIVQGGRHVWQAAPALPPPFTLPRVALVVAELIRTGLAFGHSEEVAPQIRRARVIPAPIHLRGGARSLCPINRPRYRLTEEPQVADCPMCLAMHAHQQEVAARLLAEQFS